MKIWFILIEGEVQGPFEVQEINNLIKTHPESQIWGKGQTEWMPFDKWQKLLKDLELKIKSSPSPTRWKYRLGSKESSALDFNNLIRELKKLSDFSKVELKSDKENSWHEIYAYEDIVFELGITRRSHPRAPIVGQLFCEKNGESFELKLSTISQGGLGATGNSHLNIGEYFNFKLVSPSLPAEIFGNAEVIYNGNDGYIGTKFNGLAKEFESVVNDYVKKFFKN